ncbi:neprilysin-1-like [Dermacentor andersoni]|uniref:neprilysin-1-like n=1 Tax=Dermacentor andersoni TaxID=34620 RepID=UPI0024172A2C|nr:neprilysin-1-like [Dermacentor andersoni]
MRNIAAVYTACKAVPTENDRPDILEDILKTFGFQHWPITTDKHWVFQSASEVLNLTGLDPILDIYVSQDVQNLTSYIIQLDEVSFMKLGRNQLTNPDTEENKPILNAYKNLIEVAIKFVKPNITHYELTRLVCDVLLLELQLANLTTPPEQRRNLFDIYHRVTIGELEAKFPNIPLHDLLNKKFSKANITLGKNETLELYALEYYNRTNDLLPAVDAKTLFNYAGLRVVLGWATDLSKDYHNASFQLRKVAWGVQAEMARWSKCMSFLTGAMRDAMGNIYARKKFSAEAKQEMLVYVDKIKDVFRKELENNKWMDEVTKSAAKEKLDKMAVKIGYPEEIMNMSYLEERYKYIPALNTSSHFIEMWRYIVENNDRKQIEKLRVPYDRNSWIVGSAVVNAFYNPSTNDMYFPSGILQGLFYQHGLPNSVNYGSIGAIIGHEITHGFDDEGSQYDADGKLKQWWSNGTRSKFEKKANCFVQQYGSIRDKTANMTLDGKNTLGENIADNGGLRMAFKAYTALNDDTRLKTLEDISGKKLFFISRAVTRCSLRTTASLRMQIQYDPHSPAQYRMNEPVKNMQAFARVFNCSVGSQMHPKRNNACTLW